MNFDRNTILGFVLLAVLFFGYFFYINKEKAAFNEQARIEQAKKDSINRLKVDTAAQARQARYNDSMAQVGAAGQMDSLIRGTEQLTTVETDLLRVAFTNKGGQPKYVELKGFKGPDSGFVRLGGAPGDRIDYNIITGTNASSSVSNFYFTGGQVAPGADGSQVVTFRLNTPNGPVQHQYVIRKGHYMMDFNLTVPTAAAGGQQLTLNWSDHALALQKDIDYERQMSAISYREDGDYDDENVLGSGPLTFEKPVNWVAVKQQFFNQTLLAKSNFASGTVQWTTPQGDSAARNPLIVNATASMKLVLPATGTAALGLYYGPNDYKILQQYGNDLSSMVNLGSGMFAFVKYLNRWIIIPVFDFFRGFVSNYGIVILLLTLFIRLLISPLTYSSYLSGAKMKALKPEIDKLKEKHEGDQQAVSMGQMQLFREAGVNPLGGCIPALLQIPIFFALYSFFNSAVALRGEKFLWADDLSQYDAPINFGFHIPLLGEHLSLFTITAVLTSLAISLYSMSMTPTQDNPMMKYMPYIFPVVMLFIFNKLPSALTWYYTVSNVITLLLQFVIQNYIINHDKILLQLEENRKKPKKPGLAERMQAMQEQQRKLQELQNKGKKK
ncbi:membrane protein insertase YidC [Flaviaesturariibacter amylovorans]|uniref:Membrane protein insertase YidC n=1 Tax=Flaviaesturariibacter amylovorans TaxID=1084520 RepID=A0ABP8GM80_9BACT